MAYAECRDGSIAVQTVWTEKELIKQVPGSRWNPDSRDWELPLTWASCVTARGVFPDLRVGPELARWAWEDFHGRVEPVTAVRELLEPVVADPARDAHGLRRFQEVDVEFMRLGGSVLLANDMGLGKTISVLTALRRLGRERALPALVICPNSTKTAWEKHARNWYPDARPYVVHGGAAGRRKILAAAAENPRALVIINLESVRLFSRLTGFGSIRLARCRACDSRGEEGLTASRCEVHPKELNGFGFQTVVLDEAHRIKEPSSKQTRACWAVGHDPSVQRRWALTGTPIANHVGDLWSVMHFVAPTEYPVKGKFVDRYCTPPDAPVWMADGTFKPIGDIVEGDTVIGFTKDPILGKGLHPKLQPTRVLRVHRHVSEVLQVTLASGRTVRCTPNHRWLVGWRRPRSDSPRVMMFDEVAVGRRLRPVLTVPPPLPRRLERDAAWLGGIYDGEGSGLFISQSRRANPDVHAEIGRVLKALEFDFYETDFGFKIRGGRSAYAKMLHYCQPTKRHATSAGQRYDHVQHMFYGAMGSSHHKWDEIVAIESLGEGSVVSLTTETETYVVYGYASHNSLQSWNPFGGLDIVGVNPHTREEFYKILDPRFRRLTKAEVLDLPPKIRSQRWVDMSAKQKRAYDDLAAGALTVLENGQVLVAPGNLDASIRLLQLASSYCDVEWVERPLTVHAKCKCYASGLDRHAEHCPLRLKMIVTLREPSPKLDALEEVHDELGPRQYVVSAMHRKLIELAAARYEKRKIPFGLITGPVGEYERERVKERFIAGDLQVIMFTLAAGGTGLDGLQVCDTMVRLQRSWSMIDNVQAEDRYYRIGSEVHDSVHLIDIVTRGTTEETEQMPRLLEKSERLDEITRDRARLAAADARRAELDAEYDLIVNSDLGAP